MTTLHRTPIRAGSRFGALELWVVLSLGAAALLPIYLATAARPTSGQKAAQAVVFAGIFLTALPVLLASARRRVTGPVLATYGVMLVFAAPAITQRYFRPSWMIGDVLLLSTPILLGLALHSVAQRHPRLPHRALHLIVGSLFIAAVVASRFPDPLDSNRYNPPAPLLMCAVFVYVVTLRGVKRVAAGVAIPVVAVLTWNSQWRSSFAVFALIGVVTVVLLLKQPMRLLFLWGCAVVLALVLGFGLTLPAAGGSSSNNRIMETFQGGGIKNDSSTSFRFTEASAVIATAKQEWFFPNIVLGGGHGATYNLSNLAALPLSDRFVDRNGRDGRVHNIHLGALMLSYRYGLLGIAIVLFFMYRIGLATRTSVRSKDYDCFMVTLATVGCAILHLANNVTTQIQFTVTVAVLIPLLAQHRSDVTHCDAQPRESGLAGGSATARTHDLSE
jgi:hypothetical protein